MKAPLGAFLWRFLFPRQSEEQAGCNNDEGQNKPDRQGDIHDREGFAVKKALNMPSPCEPIMKFVSSG